MPSIGPYTASIIVDGEPLEEYKAPQKNEHERLIYTEHCFIEAVHGVEFGIRLKNTEVQKSLTSSCVFFNVDVDGKRVKDSGALSEWKICQLDFTGDIEYVNGVQHKQYLAFNTLLQPDQKHNLSQTIDLHKDCGQIQVTLHPSHMRKMFASKQQALVVIPMQNPPAVVATKGASIDTMIYIGSRPVQKAEEALPTRYEVVVDKEPAATFIFNYRSRNMLKALGIIKDEPDEDVAMSTGADLVKREEESKVAVKNEPLLKLEDPPVINHVGQDKVESHDVKQIKTEPDTNSIDNNKKRASIELSDDEEDLTVVDSRPCKRLKRKYVDGVDQLEDLTKE